MTDSLQKCLAIIAVGADSTQTGKLAMAEGAFKMALAGIRSCAPEEATCLALLIQLNQSLLRTNQGRPLEAQELRKEAIGALDSGSARPESAGLCYLTGSVLQILGDYRRAILFWEQAIQLADPNAESDRMASMLHKLGECFSRIGLKDHAIIPLRASLRLLEFCHEDPRRSATLITLGRSRKHLEQGG
jgi:tetratricopeptide (TPR) repeat protein